jgi:metal iron transporter
MPNIRVQALAVKLGSVTGMDLAQMNRAHLPRWLNIGLWIMAEAAIICTDIGQVRLLRDPTSQQFTHQL